MWFGVFWFHDSHDKCTGCTFKRESLSWLFLFQSFSFQSNKSYLRSWQRMQSTMEGKGVTSPQPSYLLSLFHLHHAVLAPV